MAFTLKAKKSLTSILSGFTKTLAELEALQTANKAVVDANNQTISGLQADNANLSDEASKAEGVAKNIKAILGEK